MSAMPSSSASIQVCVFAMSKTCATRTLTMPTNSCASNKTRLKNTPPVVGSPSPLNDGLIHLVGKPKEGETKESLVFNLPSYEGCCKSVKRWVERAGIDKHISWHCARHSFAMNILNNGANIKTVASLLGHSGLKHTEKYTRAVDKLKEDAINSLPALNL